MKPFNNSLPRQNEDEITRLEAVMKTYESALLRYVSGLIRDTHAARDVTQKVFIKYFARASAQNLPPERLRQWLYRVAHNEAIDHIRRESRVRRLHESMESEPDFQLSTAQAEAFGDKMAMVFSCIHRLLPSEQQVLLLRFQEGLSYEEISRITSRSQGNIGCLLHHALRKLAKIIKTHAGSLPKGES